MSRRVPFQRADQLINFPITFSMVRMFSSASGRFEGNDLSSLLEQNKAWAAGVREELPTFFEELSDQQSPKILWVGCSDSRVPANQIVGLMPGEVFVHRNIANVVNHVDMNFLSVLQYAVEVLKVRHVIVCGHYGCGGVRAAMGNQQFGLIDNWLRNIKDTYHENCGKLDAIGSAKEKEDLMVELNVAKSVYNVCRTTIAQNAWANGQPLYVHGWCYRLTDGIIRDLKLEINGADQVEGVYNMVISKKTPEV